jgi:hypothetical protein
MCTKSPIICYHPGARGDFLRSVLYGNRLQADQNHATVHDPGSNSCINVEKVHWYSDIKTPVHTELDFKKFMSMKISVDTLQEQKEVAWLMLVKHSELFNFKINNDKYIGTTDLVKTWATTFKDVEFDLTIPFKNLFCIDYLSQLCIELSLDPLSDIEQARIQKNINLNLDILKSM